MKVVALAGGVGGAKMVYGLDRILPHGDLSIIVNTGDDFEHYGLYICPDLDTVCYHLADINNLKTGWGRDKDTFFSLSEAMKLGGPDWFQIGDHDLGTHLERTRRLRNGEKLSAITMEFCRLRKIKSHVYPMTNDKVSTFLRTKKECELPFQEYFVHRHCQPEILSIRFEGAEIALPLTECVQAIQAADVIIICPSNPWVSIDPILAIPGIKKSIKGKRVIAVSPIIQGKAIKGPAAKMFVELGMRPSALAVLQHYKDLICGFIYDKRDVDQEKEIEQEGIISLATNTIMHSKQSKMKLAQDILEFSKSLS
jgi:LPPG:FO 2-phospho-L-lactate transferase